MRLFFPRLAASVLMWAPLFLSACSDEVNISPGLVTVNIQGRVRMAADVAGEEAFIIVRKHHRVFLQNSTGYLHRVSASLIHPDDDGHYHVRLESEVDRVDMTLIAKGCLIKQHTFDRTIGISAYKYNTELEKDPNWRNSYYLMIKPILSEYITEQRYRMKQIDQMFLGNWLQENEGSF